MHRLSGQRFYASPFYVAVKNNFFYDSTQVAQIKIDFFVGFFLARFSSFYFSTQTPLHPLMNPSTCETIKNVHTIWWESLKFRFKQCKNFTAWWAIKGKANGVRLGLKAFTDTCGRLAWNRGGENTSFFSIGVLELMTWHCIHPFWVGGCNERKPFNNRSILHLLFSL